MSVFSNYKCDNQMTIFDMLSDKKEFSIDNSIRLIELFSGYGSQCMALKRLGADFEHYKISEWEINANKSYHAIHNPSKNQNFGRFFTKEELVNQLLLLGVSNDGKTPMTKENLMRKSEDWLRDVYNEFKNNNNLGSVCGIKGRDLEITDTDKYTYLMTYSFPCFTANSLILTTNGYKKIKDVKEGDSVLTHNNQYKKVLASMCTGRKKIFEIKAAGTDKLECTENHKYLVTKVVDNKITQPSWVETKDLTDEHYLMMPINSKEIIPKIQNFELADEKFWYRLGEIVYQMASKLKNIDTKYDNELMTHIIDTFIDDKKHVCIPNYVLDLPVPLLKSFIDGFMIAKQNRSKDKVFGFIGKRGLVYMLGQCIAKVYKKPFLIRGTALKNECKIEFGKSIPVRDMLYISGYLLYRITSITDLGLEEKVYDIEVEDDHSFVVNNCIAHNCQDLSLSGKGKGMKKGSGTRSGLLWEVERILQEIVDDGTSLPQVLLMENVPQVINSKNKPDFDEWLHFLEGLGYSNHYQVVNAKDCNIAQSRKRCFMVSLLGDYEYEFPKPIPLTNYLRDYLEESVDEKYYIYSENAKKLIKELVESGRLNDTAKNTEDKGVIIDDTTGFEDEARIYDEYSPSLRSSRAGLKTIVAMRGRNPENPTSREAGLPTEQRLEPNDKGLCNTLTTVSKDNLLLEEIPIDLSLNSPNAKSVSNCITARENRGISNHKQEGTDVLEKITSSDNIEVLGNYNKSGYDASRVVSTNGIAPTVKENHGTITGIVDKENSKNINYRIRKLTERECGRLMGVSDEDITKMKSVCCSSQLYKQYGNSIVVDCLVAIMSQLGIKGVPKWNDCLLKGSSSDDEVVGISQDGIKMLGLLDIKGNEQIRRVYGTDGIAPTITTMQGGNRQPKILEFRQTS